MKGLSICSIVRILLVLIIMIGINLSVLANSSSRDSLEQITNVVNDENNISHEWHLTESAGNDEYWYENLKIFKDTVGIKDFDQLRSINPVFELNNTKESYQSNEIYWAKIILHGNPAKSDYYLFNLAHDDTGKLSWLEIDAWFLHQNGQIDHQKTGFALAKKEKSIPVSDNLVHFLLEKGEKGELYIRLKGVKRFIKPGFIQFGVVTENWWAKKNINAWKSGSLLAVLVIQLLYFLILFIVEKEKIHFYFSLSILGLLLEYCSRFLNEFSMTIGSIELIAFSGIPIFLIGLTKYTSYYFNTSQTSPFSKKVMPSFIGLCLFCLVFFYVVFGLYHIQSIPTPIISIMTFLMILIVLSGISICAYLVLIADQKLKIYRRFYLLSFSPILLLLLSFIIFIISSVFGSVPDAGWFITSMAYSQDISLFLMMILLALSNGYRARQEKKDKLLAIQKDLIYQQQNKLYTNITHEFRTPLTVILGMTEQIGRKPKTAAELIKRNGENLLNLVNQILDLSKLESGNLKLNLINLDVIKFLLYLAESCQSLAESKKIKLTTYSEPDTLLMDIDDNKLQQIVTNLLSNAIKFTPPRGKIIFHIAQTHDSERNLQYLQIKVKDNGIGISPKHLDRVFDRFYQVNGASNTKKEGSGIGLSLVKELVKLMGGQLSLKSEVGKGSEFKILLPIINSISNFSDASLLPSQSPATSASTPSDLVKEELNIHKKSVQPNKPLLLIIEDNQDVITYIVNCLEDDYLITVATDGQQGINKALEEIPDIILSDVMMPEKDGFEVCTALKSDERTNHIPIILLTAKYTDEYKIEGLSHGADAYLTKPFVKEELLIRLEQLVALRKLLQNRYSDLSSKNAPSSPEEAFLSKFRFLVEENISDNEFGIPQLCKGMGMSRSQIYRKLSALTGKSTSIFIRSIRLHKAKELFTTTDFNVSQVAYDVGFTDPLYFSRVFSQEFGYPPSKIKNQQ